MATIHRSVSCFRALLIATITFWGCASTINNEELTRGGWWQLTEGHLFEHGDILDFKGCTIDHDTIIVDCNKIGVITSRMPGRYGHPNEIMITSLDGKDSAVYTQK